MDDETLEVSWDTEELIRWMVNDEGLYDATSWHYIRTHKDMEIFWRDIAPAIEYLDVDLDNIDWQHVLDCRNGDEAV